jgi:hypothetical protein
LVFSLTLVWAAFAGAQSTELEVEVGYQVLDVSGNEDMYRTQVNDDDGPVLRSLSLSAINPAGGHGLFDRLRVDAGGFGGNPSGLFRLEAGKADAYRLRLAYRRMESFSALPALANPLLDDGIVPGQHTFDRDRDLLDLDLEILPGRVVTPLVGLSWNRFRGPRRTTYHVGQDEFLLASDLEETEQELRAGLTFTAGRFQGTLIQGWREFEGRERLSLVPGAGNGNNLDAVLGEDVTLADLQRDMRTDAETPVTTAHVTGRIGDRLGLSLSFVHADFEADTASFEVLSGSLVSFALSRYFAGLEESIRSRSDNPAWRGDLRLSADLSQRISVTAGYSSRHRELDGWALVSSLYLDTLNFSGADPDDISRLVEAETGFEREEQVVDLRVTARDLGPFKVWAGWSMVDQDLDVDADVAEIIVPGGQSGSFDRSIDSYSMGAALELADLDLSLEWHGADADEAVVRTDFSDRDRFRLRLGWSFAETFRVLATAELIRAENATEGIGYDAATEHYGVEVRISPVDDLTLRLAYDGYTTDTEIVIRAPQDLSLDRSIHSEAGDAIDFGLLWTWGRFGIDAGYTMYSNDGSFAFDLDRPYARLSMDFNDDLGAAIELERYEYREEIFTPADYESTRYGLYLLWRL